MNPPRVYMCSPSWTPPPTSPTFIPSFWVIPVHQPRASCIMHRTWTGDSFHIWYYTFQCHSPKSAHPRPLPQSPKDCSIHLCLFCCLAYKVIVTIFLKTSRLMVKSFSTVRDTQKGSQSYMEMRRERRELELTRMRWGGIKRGESRLASNHFLMCAPQSGPLRDAHGVIQRREEGGRRQRWPGG